MIYKKLLISLVILLSLLSAAPIIASPIKLTNGKYDVSKPQWSPNGKWIGFTRNKNGKLELAVVHPDSGGKPTILATNVAYSSNFNWSSNSSALTYTGLHKEKKWIYTVNVKSHKVNRLIEGFSPKFSPSGRYIALMTSHDIKVIDLKNNKIINLTKNKQPAWMQQLCWASNSKKIFYARDGDLWEIDMSGASDHRILEHNAKTGVAPDIAQPTVTKGGKLILYSLITDGLYAGPTHNLIGSYDLTNKKSSAITDADGWSINNYTDKMVISVGGKMWLGVLNDKKFDKKVSLGSGTSPSISPDGKRIVYVSRPNLGENSVIIVRSLP